MVQFPIRSLCAASLVACTTFAQQNASTYDYIIVGGGTAGLTVADRLTENGKRKIISLSYTNPLVFHILIMSRLCPRR
jgi:ribulose 1,5-bisphosphate synthetase/thiazole synthase